MTWRRRAQHLCEGAHVKTRRTYILLQGADRYSTLMYTRCKVALTSRPWQPARGPSEGLPMSAPLTALPPCICKQTLPPHSAHFLWLDLCICKLLFEQLLPELF